MCAVITALHSRHQAQKPGTGVVDPSIPSQALVASGERHSTLIECGWSASKLTSRRVFPTLMLDPTITLIQFQHRNELKSPVLPPASAFSLTFICTASECLSHKNMDRAPLHPGSPCSRIYTPQLGNG